MTGPPAAADNAAKRLEQFAALLEVTEAIAQHRDLPGLFQDLAPRLREVVPFDAVNLLLFDPAKQVMRLHLLETLGPLQPQPELPIGREVPVEDSLAGWVWTHQQPLCIADLATETRFPKVLETLRQHGVRSCWCLPLSTAQRRLGAIGFGSFQTMEECEADLDFLMQVARQVAVAVDNVLHLESAEQLGQQLQRERDRLSTLLEITNAVVSILDFQELFGVIAGALRRILRQEFTTVALYDPDSNSLRVHALNTARAPLGLEAGLRIPLQETPAAAAITSRRPVVLSAEDLAANGSVVARRLLEEGVRSGCCVPLNVRNRTIGTLNAASLADNAFSPEDVEFLEQVAGQLAIAIDNALAYGQIAELKDKLAEEKLYLESEIRTSYNFEEIIGDSPALANILQQVQIVAPTDSAVLIRGETGTGKELIARAIHNLSGRRERTFVKINCAAIPTGLLESELFGHEKGAFTGAISQKIGRFELAHRGTLFLDEVGDIPPELQPKLLRVLQEQEFERLGGTRTIKVDVRLVAATNRNLEQLVAERSYRSDLYYRLNVFPIQLPALRQRRDDIPLLVRYFAQKAARRMNRRIETIPAKAMEVLVAYSWPGNVRELENFIERAVILSPGPALRVPVAELSNLASQPVAADEAVGAAASFEDAQRAAILQALHESDWVIGGARGAAERLGMNRTTLQSKMRKLGISRPKAR